MKKLYTSGIVVMLAFLGFAAAALAQEASYFDGAINGIIRAYATENCPSACGTYTVKIEAVDPATNSLINPGTLTGLTSNPEIVDGNASNPDVSLSCDERSNKLYLFYNGGEQLVSFTFGLSNPQTEVVATPNPADFGSVTVGSLSSVITVTVTNTGAASATLGTLAVDSTGLSKGFKMKSGGTCALTGQALAASASCTVRVIFKPVAAGAASGTLLIPFGASQNANVTLTGTGVAPAGFANLSVAVEGASGGNNNEPFDMMVTVTNNGNAAAGSFNVKMWLTLSGAADESSQLLYTWNVSGLSAGQSLSHTFSPLSFSGAAVHAYYYILTEADAGKTVTESDETDNKSLRSFYIYR